jgi:putative peptide zinc metalloprotease protein
VCEAFERRFREPLAEQDLATLIEALRGQRLLVGDGPPLPRPRQRLLSWRARLWNPDRLFASVEPRVRFLFTRSFATLAATVVVAAALVLWVSREELARSAHDALCWESALPLWCVYFALGLLHESSHGLACKHYGGEVKEIGFLFLFFVPCFYCNVTDAWLFRAKHRRIAVMLAGVACDLVVGAIAAFIWRVASPDTIVHRTAFLVLSVSGLDTLTNLNPLLKFDGYYVLSDWAEVPNLRARAIERAKGHLRRWLCGAPPPGPEPRARFLTGFGLLSWAFSLVFLVCMLVFVGGWLDDRIGVAGWAVAALLALPGAVELFRNVGRRPRD